MVAGADLREIVGEVEAAIDHHGGAAAAPRPLLKGRQHLVQRGAVLAVAVEDFVGLRKPVAVQDQPDDDLLAVGAVIARVPALRLRIVRAPAFEVGGRQVVQVDRVVEVEQRALARGQRLLDHRTLPMQSIEVAIQRLVTERAEVGRKDIGQGGAPDPGRHRMFRGRAHQPVERHDLGQQPRAGGEAGGREDRVQRERSPHLMADVDGTGFADVFASDLIGVDRDDVVTHRRSRRGMGSRRAGARREPFDGRLGVERRLTPQGRGEFAREAAPLVGGRRRERTERANRAVAWALRGGDGLDEEMIDVRPIANTAERTFDEHAEAISLLRPSPCQGKSRQELVTILAISGARPRNLKGLHGMDARKSPFARRGPWKLG